MGNVELHYKEQIWQLIADTFAVETTGYRVKVLSAVGPSTTVKAVAAAMRGGGYGLVKFSGFSTDGKETGFDKDCCFDSVGYRLSTTFLGMGLWHLMAVSRDPGLILGDRHEAVWAKLRTEQYTVPVLKRWVPWLTERFEKVPSDGKLLMHPLVSVGCKGFMLFLTDERLEKDVSEGLRTKQLKIREG